MSGAPRERLLLPILIPVAALAVIGFVLFVFSRILLDVSHTAASVVALLVAAAIMAIAGYVSTRERLTGASLWSMAGAVLGVGMLIGGVALLVGQPHAEEEEPTVLQIAAPPGAATAGFDSQVLQGPADEPFDVELRNEDDTVHNFTRRGRGGRRGPRGGPRHRGRGARGEHGRAGAPGRRLLLPVHAAPDDDDRDPVAQRRRGPDGASRRTWRSTPTVIVLPPDLESTITLDNEDAGTEHNIAIYTDESASEALFQGQQFPGVATETYTVPAIAPGEYYFHCDVHPDMHGTVEVGARAGGRRRGAAGRGTTARRLGPGRSCASMGGVRRRLPISLALLTAARGSLHRRSVAGRPDRGRAGAAGL